MLYRDLVIVPCSLLFANVKRSARHWLMPLRAWQGRHCSFGRLALVVAGYLEVVLAVLPSSSKGHS